MLPAHPAVMLLFHFESSTATCLCAVEALIKTSHKKSSLNRVQDRHSSFSTKNGQYCSCQNCGWVPHCTPYKPLVALLLDLHIEREAAKLSHSLEVFQLYDTCTLHDLSAHLTGENPHNTSTQPSLSTLYLKPNLAAPESSVQNQFA